MPGKDSDGRGRNSVRRWLHVHLDPAEWPGHGLSPLNYLIVAVICLATGLAIVETEPTVTQAYGRVLGRIDDWLVWFFAAEFGARLWSAAENRKAGGGWKGRIKFLFSFAALVDLFVIASSFLAIFDNSTSFLRMIRLLRLLLISRLGRFSEAIADISEAVHSRRHELLLSLVLSVMLLLLGASALWLAEGAVQPKEFGSIPRSLWWAMVTLTTIGYGDAYPVTVMGKILASVVAVAGIGLIALPSGILTAAFSEVAHRKKEQARGHAAEPPGEAKEREAAPPAP